MFALLHLHGIHFQKLQTHLSFMELLSCFALCGASHRFPLKPCRSLTKESSLGIAELLGAREAAESEGKKLSHFGMQRQNWEAFVRYNDTY